MTKIICNTRTLSGPFTGVQRYTTEILSRFDAPVERIAPASRAQGTVGHLWEQTVLPLHCQGRVLWSPSNTGPLAVSRQVLTVHDLVPLEHPEWVGKRFGAWYRWLQGRLIPKVDAIIAISEFTRDVVVEHYKIPAERIVVIPNGVGERFHPRSADEIDQAVASCKLPSRKYVLSLCSLEPRKNLGRLLEAWSSICDSIDEDIVLVLAGKVGSHRVFPALNLPNEPKRVFFPGHINDEQLPALMSGALAFVYPSIYEGFGLPPLEAMACGVPVITSSVTAIPEVVGSGALQVNPLDSTAIAEALQRLLSDSELRHQLGAMGRKQAQKFTWDKTAIDTLEVLRSI